MTQDKISATIEQQTALLDPFLNSQKAPLTELANQLVATFHRGGRIFILGSGPFGAIASLLGQTFLHRQTLERPALPAIALTHDAGLATALAADDQSSQLFSRQLRALATEHDTILLLSGTELCAADLEAIATGKQLGCRTVLICSDRTEFTDQLPDLTFPLPSDSPPRLLEGSLLIGNLLCALVEGELFGI